jgi:hypothetical protein
MDGCWAGTLEGTASCTLVPAQTERKLRYTKPRIPLTKQTSLYFFLFFLFPLDVAVAAPRLWRLSLPARFKFSIFSLGKKTKKSKMPC